MERLIGSRVNKSFIGSLTWDIGVTYDLIALSAYFWTLDFWPNAFTCTFN